MNVIPLAFPLLVTAGGDPVDSVNEFAFDLYREAVEGDDNAFMSPYGVASAFAMCLAATDGATHDQIAAVTRLSEVKDAHRIMGAMQRKLNEPAPGAAFSLTVANRLWGHRGLAEGYYEQRCLDLIAVRYDAGWETVDFARPDDARGTINAWVSARTNDRIPELIPTGVLSDLSRLVITNTVHFKAAWAYPFEPRATRPMPFRTPGGSVSTDTMMVTAPLAVLDRDGVRVVKLPYVDETVSMVVLMPDGIELEQLERTLTAPQLAGWLDDATSQRVMLFMPKFELTASYKLHETVLPKMGMTAPFQPTRDWTPLNGDREPLRIHAVLHDAFVKVDEKGTEAAAATAVGIMATSVPPPVRIDRSFVFAIVHERTGLILFTGRVVDPTRS